MFCSWNASKDFQEICCFGIWENSVPGTRLKNPKKADSWVFGVILFLKRDQKNPRNLILWESRGTLFLKRDKIQEMWFWGILAAHIHAYLDVSRLNSWKGNKSDLLGKYLDVPRSKYSKSRNPNILGKYLDVSRSEFSKSHFLTSWEMIWTLHVQNFPGIDFSVLLENYLDVSRWGKSKRSLFWLSGGDKH